MGWNVFVCPDGTENVVGEKAVGGEKAKEDGVSNGIVDVKGANGTVELENIGLSLLNIF
jgi:hypothetical protein